MLHDLGLLDEAPSELERVRFVSGTVRRDDGLPAADVLARESHEIGRFAVRLGEATTDAEGC